MPCHAMYLILEQENRTIKKITDLQIKYYVGTEKSRHFTQYQQFCFRWPVLSPDVHMNTLQC